MTKPLIEVEGFNGTLILTKNTIIIKRRGLRAHFFHGFKGDKEIPIKNITAVQLKKRGLLNGYIQFSMKGYSESKGGIFDATKDENTVMFSHKEGDDKKFERIRNYVLKKIV